MGNKESNENAEEFFTGFGNGLVDRFDQGFGGIMNTVNAPAKLAGSVGEYINSPLGGIMIPIMLVGGLFVVITVFGK